MKPKYPKLFRQLPVAIFVASSMTAQATIFNDDSAGNAQPTSADNGATTIVADGGTASAPFVLIVSGVNMTGDPAQGAVLLTSNKPYLVTVEAGGVLAGSPDDGGEDDGVGHDGIFATSLLTLNNSGTVSGSGGTGFQGVETIGSTSVLNNFANASISGTDDAIRFTSAGGIVHNSGLIDGVAGAGSSGIAGSSDMNITNTGSDAVIRGIYFGIDATSGLTVVNGDSLNDGTPLITSTADNAINATSGATITNYGAITGFKNGINVTDGAVINNNTSFNVFGDLVAGGSITGGAGFSGIVAGNSLNLTNESLSTISGGADGVRAENSATIVNNVGASIDGTNGFGVYMGSDANLTNNGTITGGSTGLRVGGGTSTILNRGLISGNLGIEAYAGSGSTFTFNNTGTVTGTNGTAIDGLWGTDNLNFYAGSEINGDVRGENGSDNFVMNSDTGFGDSSIVNGDIVGGSSTDVLTFQNGRTVAGGSVSIVNGDVTQMEDIIKDGFGASFIGAPGDLRNVQSDEIHVNSGALYINGNVDATNIIDNFRGNGLVLDTETTIIVGGTNNEIFSLLAAIPDSAEIGGTGTWNANITITNGGISPGGAPIGVAGDSTFETVATLLLSPGDPLDAIGTLTVTGDISLDSASYYRWDVDPYNDIPGNDSSAADLIRINGLGNQFAVDGSEFRLSPTNVNTPLQDGSRIVVDTDDALIGSFGSITLSPFPDTTPDFGPFHATQIDPIIVGFSHLDQVDGGEDWALTITHEYDAFGATPNERAAGKMLNGLANIDPDDPDYDPIIADLLAAMDYSQAAVTEAVLAALDPTSYFATANALANNNYRLHRTVETHNAAVRASSGATTTMTSGGGYTSAKGQVVSAPTVTTSSCGASNVWGSFSYDWQDFNADDSHFDSDGETGSFTAGIDFTIANNFRLGLVAEGSRTSWDGDVASSDIDSYRFAAYANWGESTGWFVDALVGYNTHSIDQDRSIGLGVIGFNDSFNSSYDADGWQAFVNVGHAFQTGFGLVSPFIGVEWQQLNVDGFDEDDGLFSLDDYNVDSLRGLAGVKWEMGLGTSATLYATAAYAHEFQDSADDVTVHFGPGSYDAEGLDMDDSVLLSAGLRWSVTDCTTIDFGYRGELGLGDNGLDSHGANVGVNYAF